MSSIYSAASEDFPSDSNELECGLSHSAKLIPSPAPSSPSAGPEHQSIQTSRHLQPNASGQMELTLTPSEPFAAGFPAKTSAKRSRARSELTAANPGLSTNCSDLSTKSNQDSSSSKTHIGFAVSDWIASSGSSMISGMMRSGMCSELPTLGRRIVVDASTLWPTPTATRRSGLQSHGKNAILGPLNPMFLEWLMGFPINHTNVEFSETPSSHKSLKSSGGRS